MSENEPQPVRASTENTPAMAVGFVATETNSEELTRGILRATEHEHKVFVTHYGAGNTEAIRFAEQLGVIVVEPTDDDPDTDSLRRDLAATARAHACEGLIFQPDAATRINYGQSKQALEENGFTTDAIPETNGSDSEADYILSGIPAYNEASSIERVVREARQYTDDVLVVDDGSTDDTAALAHDAGSTIVSHDENSGYGATLKTLFEEADRIGVDHLVVLDGDGQHEPGDIERLVETQRETDTSVVIGSRFVDDAETDAPLYRRIGLWIITLFANISMGRLHPSGWVRDTQSGFRAYDRDAIASLAASSNIADRMSASIDILFHASKEGLTVQEVPTSVYYSVDHSSTHNPISHGVTIIHNIIRTVESERPVTILGIPGFLVTVIGFGFFYWTAANYLSTGSFPLGLGIVTVLFLLTGVFSTFTAIILHALNHHLD